VEKAEPCGCFLVIVTARSVKVAELPAGATQWNTTRLRFACCHFAVVVNPTTQATVYFGVGAAPAMPCPRNPMNDRAVAPIKSRLFIAPPGGFTET